jgi:hypothetical protein
MSIDPLILAYFGPSDHELHGIWMEVGKKNLNFALYSVSDDSCHQKYSAQRPGLVIFKNLEKPSVYNGSLTIDKISHWINTERKPAFFEFNQASVQHVFGEKRDMVVLFENGGSSTTEIRKKYVQVANLMKD